MYVYSILYSTDLNANFLMIGFGRETPSLKRKFECFLLDCTFFSSTSVREKSPYFLFLSGTLKENRLEISRHYVKDFLPN